MNGKQAVQKLTLANFLSYGKETLDLLPLNVVIGPNASGKSNLLEALAVLRAAALNLAAGLRDGGGVGDYIGKNTEAEYSFSIIAVVGYRPLLDQSANLRYEITVDERNQRPWLTSEHIFLVDTSGNLLGYTQDDYTVYFHLFGEVLIRQFTVGETSPAKVLREINPDDLQRDQSILSQRRDPELYPELTYLAEIFSRIVIFREWTFGTRTKVRLPQPADLPTDFLVPDASNLALVLHEMAQRSTTRKKLIDYLQRFYSSAQHISTKIQGGTVQLFIEEANDILVPATRLSDGTLRYLSLLAILCHPTPPPVVCIEEPELGLHPDIMPTIAELLLDASQRTQLIVTTHSDALVSALSEVPECIVVCEPGEDGTQLRRLDKDALAEWLSRYSLGEIWRMGEIGGTRW